MIALGWLYGLGILGLLLAWLFGEIAFDCKDSEARGIARGFAMASLGILMTAGMASLTMGIPK